MSSYRVAPSGTPGVMIREQGDAGYAEVARNTDLWDGAVRCIRRQAGALGWLEGLGWRVADGPHIAPGGPGAERADYGPLMMARRLRDLVAELEPVLGASSLDESRRKHARKGFRCFEVRA